METVSITFKAPEEFGQWLKKEAFDLDMTASEVIRACIAIGLPVIKSRPDLGSILAHNTRRGQ